MGFLLTVTKIGFREVPRTPSSLGLPRNTPGKSNPLRRGPTSKSFLGLDHDAE